MASRHARYRAGGVHAHVPPELCDPERPLEELIERYMPASHAALQAAERSLFCSLPVAFDPAESVGPYLAVADRDPLGAPYRFLDLGALIATSALGENDPDIVQAMFDRWAFVTSRYAHSEYQTTLSLEFKRALSRIAPAGTPRHFVVNTGSEAVENAIKSALLNRVVTSGDRDAFIVSFEGAFHGRTLGSLAVTHRKKARLGFPTFEWPHIPFPVEDRRSEKETLRREERSLKQLWDLLVSGRLPRADKSRDTFRRELDAIDDFLAARRTDVDAFVATQRAALTSDVMRRSRRVAAVLVEPIQGEGGVRMATARFMQRLRLFTRIYDVPLVFDEVQTGWGMTGRLWAHESFDLPCPPDVVTWAKKAQNGVLFVSEDLATFFQEEKKFNTTWEGDSVGMVRLLAVLDKLDLAQVQRTGARARAGLEALTDTYGDIVKNIRGAGVMLAFDVIRADWREALRDRAFRRGLILLEAGERTLRVYPRYDMEPYAIDEALTIMRLALDDLVNGRVTHDGSAPEIRVGAVDLPLETIDTIELTAVTFDNLKRDVLAVERQRYGMLQLPLETLESTMANQGAIGVALRDRVSNAIVGYALGSPLENYDEEGVASDPHFSENNTFYVEAMATLPTVQNATILENLLLDALRDRAMAAGFDFLSTLIEERLIETGPRWFREAIVLARVENYLRSGCTFVYVQAPLRQQFIYDAA
ncbi:MAG TPA: aminotransferase class III-fold pyridoxal phosphate-dependent enzyme [Vicinamibacterales bacterium]|nr:aminotransferase class III-fold pyridoxal phosphate-dependent enzyme [Vicinamibacterales bacterium]